MTSTFRFARGQGSADAGLQGFRSGCTLCLGGDTDSLVTLSVRFDDARLTDGLGSPARHCDDDDYGLDCVRVLADVADRRTESPRGVGVVAVAGGNLETGDLEDLTMRTSAAGRQAGRGQCAGGVRGMEGRVFPRKKTHTHTH